MPSKTSFKVALVTSSTRPRRLSPFITEYIRSLISPLPPNIDIGIIDLEKQDLPLFNEPVIPGHLPKEDPTPHYAHQHSRKWSAVVSEFDAFIFVTPQYNWSITAALKNAIDYLYHEWTAKPVLIVAYGSRGGNKAAAHLRQILTGLHMNIVESEGQLKISTKTSVYCNEHGHLPEDTLAVWAQDKMDSQIRQGFAQITETLEA
ncbi:hypothetical protein Golomagni_07915 [Golovinomyces magnicellulatus]|nr:hypothetical protein Golomagni_07915 [Golovinomyces magnicellulatus]